MINYSLEYYPPIAPLYNRRDNGNAAVMVCTHHVMTTCIIYYDVYYYYLFCRAMYILLFYVHVVNNIKTTTTKEGKMVHDLLASSLPKARCPSSFSYENKLIEREQSPADHISPQWHQLSPRGWSGICNAY